MRLMIDANSQRVFLYAGFSKKLAECMHIIPSDTHFDKKRKCWVGYPDAIEASLLLAKGKINESPDLVLKQLERLHYMNEATGPAPENTGRHYQSVGIAWLRAIRQGLLADEMGVGKTLQAVLAAKGLGKRTLIVCHTYSIGVWERELDKWWPGAFISKCSGTKATSIDPQYDQVLICHYDILRHWWTEIVAWGPEAIIADEGQALMSEESKRTLAFRIIRDSIQNPYVWILTGTPIPNRVRDLYSILQCISPGRFGKNFFQFGIRYCDGHKEEIEAIAKSVYKFEGASNGDELRRRMSWMTLRRTKDDVKLELPAKTRQVLWIDPKDTRGLTVPPGASRAALSGVLQAVGNAKLKEGAQIIAQRASDNGAKTVVFVWRHNVAEFVGHTLSESGFNVTVIHGGMSPARRALDLTAAKQAPSPHVVVATYDTCGVSIDMSWASLGIALEIPYEPWKLLQMESRLHRWPQTQPVTMLYIAAKQSIDERIVSIVLDKLEGQAPLIPVSSADEVRNELDPKLDDEAILREILGQ